MSSLDYPLTTMARAAVFASNGLSLTHNSPGRGTSLLLMIPLIKGHEECVDGALPLAKSCWKGDHLIKDIKIVLMAPSLLQFLTMRFFVRCFSMYNDAIF